MKKILLQFVLLMVCAVTANAQAPQRFNYQGVARSTTGAPLASVPIGLRLTIHDGSTTGTVVYQETHTATTNAFGLYNVSVGGGTVTSGMFASIGWGSGSKYLEVEIDPAGGSSYSSVGSNQLLSVPYAMYSATSALATSGVTAGTYGSATQVPQIAIDVYGRVTSASNVSITSGGLTGSGTTNYLPKFTGATTVGNSQIFDNATSVGIGTTIPSAKLHVNGSLSASVILGGITFDHHAMIVQTSSTSTIDNSRALIGYAANSSVENQGLFGLAAGNGASANVGVFAVGAPSVSSTGNSYGVYGYASDGANNFGVYGNGTGTGYAGYFNGPLFALSSSSGVKSFKIDHPADPANKYLYHSSVESNDMMNLYNGNIETDANGDATVALPSYFTMLNKEFKYQLTCIGQFAQAIVAEEVAGNHFKIKTDKPNVKVSWQVAGVRQDPVANANRIKDEVEKPASEKGTYLTPEIYGQSREKTLGYLKNPKQIK